jgi:hypothetical protein
VALHRNFYETLPELNPVPPQDADMVWLIYDLERDDTNNVYQLTLHRSIYTLFQPSLDQIITPQPGQIGNFLDHLQDKLDEKLENGQYPPDAPTLDEIL